MSAIRDRHNGTRLALVALAASVALLAAGVQGAAAAPSATLTPTNKCWLQVINDWLDHNGQIQGLYAIPCYTQAIQNLSKYSDLQQYSTAIDDIHRALLAAIHEERNGPGSGPTLGDNGNSNNGGPVTPSSGGPKPPTKSGGSPSPIDKIFHPSNAQSIPLPLIVLAALAVLLLLAGAGTWFARRLQAKRMTPATAPAPPQSR
jgi:hypothetical protein